MGGSAPTDGNGMSMRERWDGCPSVFDYGKDNNPNFFFLTYEYGRPVRTDERIDGGTVHARGDDGWRWAGLLLRTAMECQQENTGMNVPVFLI